MPRITPAKTSELRISYYYQSNLFSKMQEQPKFKSGVWEAELNVRDFVAQNLTP